MEIDSENFMEMDLQIGSFEDSNKIPRQRRTKKQMSTMSVEARLAVRRANNRISAQMLRNRKKEKSAEKWTKLEVLETELLELQQENRIFESYGKIEDLKSKISMEIRLKMSEKWREMTETVENLKSEIAEISIKHRTANPAQKSTIAAQKCRKNLQLKWAELELSALNLEIEIEKEREIQKLMKFENFLEEKMEEEKPSVFDEIAHHKPEQPSISDYFDHPELFDEIAHPKSSISNEIAHHKTEQRLQNQKHRRDSDERKKRRISETQISMEILESELKKIQEKNRPISEDSEIQMTWILRKMEITVEVRERETQTLEMLEKNLLLWRQRHLENEQRKSEVSPKIYRPQLCRTQREIELAEMEISAKTMEIELEVEKRMNSEFQRKF